jgi:hypothetical protein
VGPETLSRSLFGALVVLAPLLEKLAADDPPAAP